MKNHKTNAARILDKAGARYLLVPYEVDENDLSAAHAAESLGCDPERIFKTLVVKGDRTGYVVCVIPGSVELDLKKAAAASGNKSCAMLPLKDLQAVTGYIRGGRGGSDLDSPPPCLQRGIRALETDPKPSPNGLPGNLPGSFTRRRPGIPRVVYSVMPVVPVRRRLFPTSQPQQEPGLFRQTDDGALRGPAIVLIFSAGYAFIVSVMMISHPVTSSRGRARAYYLLEVRASGRAYFSGRTASPMKAIGIKFLLVAAIAVLPWRANALTGELSIGAVGSVHVSPYKSYDTTVLPLPFVTYKSDRFYAKGTSLGVHLLKNERHELSVGASYLGLEFKPRRTDDRQLKQLDKRRSTMLADISYSYVSRFGLVRTQLGQDVLGKSDGMLGNLSLHVPWMTETFVVMPGIGVQWASSKHNEYYYGVSRTEAARSGLRRCSPGNTFSPYLMLEAKYKLSDGWDVVAKARTEYVTGRLKDSPMVGKSFTTSIMAGVQYNF